MARVKGRRRATSPGSARVFPLVPRPKVKRRKKRTKRRAPAIKINANAILQW
jgi:hypothetical protein